MSTDFSIRPVGAPAPSPVVSPAGPAASSAVATDLPASQSVTAADAGSAARNDPQAASGDDSHQAYFDRSASTVVYQLVNGLTGQVVEQFPDDATLRRRAYFHSLDLSKDAPARAIPIDVLA